MEKHMESKRYNFYIEQKIHAKAVKMAKKDRRSMSYVVNNLLKCYVETPKKERG